jgi:hypothetical protein
MTLTQEERAKIMLRVIVNQVDTPEKLLELCLRFIKSRDDEVQAAIDLKVEEIIKIIDGYLLAISTGEDDYTAQQLGYAIKTDLIKAIKK